MNVAACAVRQKVSLVGSVLFSVRAGYASTADIRYRHNYLKTNTASRYGSLLYRLPPAVRPCSAPNERV